jgi:Ca2+-binding EF-hand superfamily protein
MPDEKPKRTKSKKKKEEGEAPAAAPAAAAPPPPAEKKKKAKRSGSQFFSNRQLRDFKEAFELMDADKDGVIKESDLRQTMDQLGRSLSDKECTQILGESSGPLNFTALLAMFQGKMQGGGDDEDVVSSSIKKFDDEGKIDSEKLRHALMTWGDKFSAAEVDEAFDLFPIDGNGKIDTNKLLELITGGAADEEEEED